MIEEELQHGRKTKCRNFCTASLDNDSDMHVSQSSTDSQRRWFNGDRTMQNKVGLLQWQAVGFLLLLPNVYLTVFTYPLHRW